MAQQTYAKHAHRPVLTTVAGLLTLNAIAHIAIVAYRQPSILTLGLLSLSFGVFVLVWISRAYIVRLQDRIIRMEMRWRLHVLGRDAGFDRLAIKQVTALRFASDAELPALVDKTLAENLTPDQIKRAVRDWQPDLYRT
jgi:hypothetical protein